MTLLTVLLVWLGLLRTDHCYAVGEPYKHWPLYLEVTAQLDTCTHNWYTADVFLEDERHTPSIWNHEYRPSMRNLAALAGWLVATAPVFATSYTHRLTLAGGESVHVECAESATDDVPWQRYATAVPRQWGGVAQLRTGASCG